VIVSEVIHVLNAAETRFQPKAHVDRHEVGEIIFETLKPVALM